MARKWAQESDMHSAIQAHTEYIRSVFACTNGPAARGQPPMVLVTQLSPLQCTILELLRQLPETYGR